MKLPPPPPKFPTVAEIVLWVPLSERVGQDVVTTYPDKGLPTVKAIRVDIHSPWRPDQELVEDAKVRLGGDASFDWRLVAYVRGSAWDVPLTVELGTKRASIFEIEVFSKRMLYTIWEKLAQEAVQRELANLR